MTSGSDDDEKPLAHGKGVVNVIAVAANAMTTCVCPADRSHPGLATPPPPMGSLPSVARSLADDDGSMETVLTSVSYVLLWTLRRANRNMAAVASRCNAAALLYSAV